MTKVNKGEPRLVVGRKSLNIKKEKNTSKNLKHSTNITLPTAKSKYVEDLIKRSYVKKAVKNVIVQASEPNKGKELFDEGQLIYLQVALGKIPKGDKKNISVNLKHSVLPSEPEILLITPDKKVKEENADAKNVEHYQQLLEKRGIKSIKTIIPLHQLRQEYREYEMQNRLMGLYDMILVDASVHKNVTKFMGTFMRKRNKLCSSVKLQVSNLEGAINKALAQTHMEMHGRGDCYAMQIGNTAMEEDQLVENILVAAHGLATKLPGGLSYVRSLLIKTATSSAVPFYISKTNFSAMKVPVIKKEKPKMSAAVTDELSTEMDSKVTVLANGTVVLNGSQNKLNKRKLENKEDSAIKQKKPKIEKEAAATGNDGDKSAVKKPKKKVKPDQKIKKTDQKSSQKAVQIEAASIITSKKKLKKKQSNKK